MRMPIIKKSIPTLIGDNILGYHQLTDNKNSNIDLYQIEHFMNLRTPICIRTDEEMIIYSYLLKTNDVINKFRVFNKEEFTIDEFLHENNRIKNVSLNGKQLDVEEYKEQQKKEIVKRYIPKINNILNKYQEGDFIVFFDCITNALSGHASYVLMRNFEIIDTITIKRS